MKNLMPSILAEAIGTFALTFVGAGTIIMCNGADVVAIALAHGLILGVMITATMHISGGQLNPSVSIGLAVIGKQSWWQAFILVVAQCVGSIVAALILSAALSHAYQTQIDHVKLGATLGALSSGENASIPIVMGLEIIATFFLMFAVVGTAVDQRGVGKGPHVGGFAIGLTVAADILFIGHLTGASMNPARSLGPALVGGHWEMHWVYWVAPIIGAGLAALVWQCGIGLEATTDADSGANR